MEEYYIYAFVAGASIYVVSVAYWLANALGKQGENDTLWFFVLVILNVYALLFLVTSKKYRDMLGRKRCQKVVLW